METINSIDYPVYFEDTLSELVKFIEKGKYSRCFVLTDEYTSVHCLPLLQMYLSAADNYDLIEVSAGEESKTIEFCEGIWNTLIDFGADRHALLINLGGGVIGDMGGFAASVYKRGMDFVQVPTTLLSQVDASVGGKTGIDFNNLKNILGTFTSPKAVFIEPAFLETLPPRQILSGYAEMLKHGLIADAAYWNILKIQNVEIAPSPEMVYQSVSIKNKVVVADPFEKGYRKCLNFGHTVGHAVETYSLQKDVNNHITHGEAVAIGMICEAWLSHKKASLSAEELDEISTVLTKMYPKYILDESCYTLLHTLMKTDKKNQNGLINCTLLHKIGECSIDHICTEQELCESITYYSKL